MSVRFDRPAPVWMGALILAGTLLAVPDRGHAQLQVGPQLSVGSDSGFGLGAQAFFPLQVGPAWMDGAMDGAYFFGGGVDSWIDANLNLRLVFPLAQDFSTRIGGGLNASFISLDSPEPTTRTDTNFGLNLLIGFEYPRHGVLGGRVTPFGELRTVIGGNEQVVVSGGLIFGSRDP